MKEELVDRHKEKFLTEPRAFFFAPATIALLGDFCDYAGGDGLMFATDIGIDAAVSVRDDHNIHIDMEFFNQRREAVIDMRRLVLEQEYEDVNILEALLLKLQYEGYQVEDGLNLTLQTNVLTDINAMLTPTLASLFIEIVIRRNNFSISEEKKGMYLRFAEAKVRGESPVPLHQLSTLEAKKHTLTHLAGKNFTRKDVDFDLQTHRLLIALIKRPRFVLDDNLTRRLRALQKGYDAINAYRDIPSLCAVDRDEFLRLRNAIKSSMVLKRVEHVIFENGRTHEGYDALRRKNYAVLGELMNQSHRSLQELFDYSDSFFDQLVEQMLRAGALGAKLSRFSGMPCVVALFKRDTEIDLDKLTNRAIERFERNVVIVEVTPGDGVGLIEGEL